MTDFWTIDRIREGFERFKKEHGRLPTGPEIDNLDYLPTSRQIQRRFGGLEQLRTTLGYKDVHFGKGVFRSKIANRVNTKGRDTELALEKILREKFGEVFVHTEKIFDDSKNRVDFYVYSPSGNFGIDVFYTETMKDLQKNVNIKIGKYIHFPDKLFLVVGNKDFQQKDLDESTKSKKKELPKDTHIINLKTLYDFIKPMSFYPKPF